MEKKSVKIYTLSTCSHCKAAKRFLDRHEIPYEYTDIDLLDKEERARAIEEVKQLNPRCTFPTIVIGDQVVIGHKEKEIMAALGLEQDETAHPVKKFVSGFKGRG